MKSLLIVFGVLGAGLIGAVGGRVLFPEDPSLPADDDTSMRLAARIDDLEAKIELIEATNRLSTAPADPANPAAPDFSVAEPEEIGDRPDVPATAPTIVSDEFIEEKVRKVIDERTREAKAEQARRAEAKQAEKEAAWLAKMKEQLGLTDYQEEELLKLLKQRRSVIARYKRVLATEGASYTPEQRADLDLRMKDYGRQLDQELRSLMSAAQYDAMMAQARKDRGGGKR